MPPSIEEGRHRHFEAIWELGVDCRSVASRNGGAAARHAEAARTDKMERRAGDTVEKMKLPGAERKRFAA
jgi:hypothetical protein